MFFFFATRTTFAHGYGKLKRAEGEGQTVVALLQASPCQSSLPIRISRGDPNLGNVSGAWIEKASGRETR